MEANQERGQSKTGPTGCPALGNVSEGSDLSGPDHQEQNIEETGERQVSDVV